MNMLLAGLSFVNLIGRVPGGISQGLIWGIMALGVFITFRVLDIADLSVDGSFATGQSAGTAFDDSGKSNSDESAWC